MKQEKYVAYVGTYTHENSVGIHIYDVDVEAGKLTERKVVPINNPIGSGCLQGPQISVFHCG